jgi:AcrR family transcriptional regulator
VTKAESLEITESRAGRRSAQGVETRREEILDAATELFAEHGYSDAVTQALAERLGVGKGTLYRCFPSKQDLFLAAVDRVMRRLREHIDQKLVGVDEPLDQIAVGVRRFLEFFEAHPKYAELLVQERALFKDRPMPTYLEHRTTSVTRWRALYTRLIAEGRMREVSVERISDMVGDLLYGTIFTNVFAGRRRPWAEQAQDILDFLFEGILTEPERKKRRLKS